MPFTKGHKVNVGRKIGIYKNCIICKEPFYVHNYRKKEALYCSEKCYGISKRGKPTWNKGKKMSPEHCKNLSKSHKGIMAGCLHPAWGGGKVIGGGYNHAWVPEHPFATKKGYVKQSRLICEKQLNRLLEPTEIVHHINENKLDDRPRNLFVFENISSHNTFHNLTITHPFLKTWIKSNII